MTDEQGTRSLLPISERNAPAHAECPAHGPSSDTAGRSASMILMLTAAVEQSTDVVLITEAEPVDQPGPRIVYVNPAFERMTGYAPAEVLGRTPRVLQGPGSDRAALDRIRTALKSWKPSREVLLNYRKDGSPFWVDLSIVPIANEDGWYTHWLSIQRDVTEQHDDRENLYDSQERLKVLTESMPQLVWTASSEGLCQFVNQTCADFIGVSPAECLGGGWYRFIHPDDLAPTEAKWTEAVRLGTEFMVEYRLRRYDGQYLWFLHRAVPRRGPNGNVMEWVGTSTEIETRKRSEEALRQTEKLAAVGRLASSIAHEINNPLNSVTNLLYLLSSNRSLDRAAREYIRTAQEELARISEITTQALRFHRQSVAPVPTRISEILDSVLALYRGRIVNCAIKLDREYQRVDPLTCSSGDIRQCLANIIGNAIEASPTGGRLRIRLRKSSGGKAHSQVGVRIIIADTGHGIQRDLRARIFEPFFTTKGATGTGLGLWITRDLIEKHGGLITVRSSTKPEASGTVFSIFLPFEPQTAT